MNGFLRHTSGRPWRGSRGRVLGLGGLGALWILTRGRAEAATRGVLRGLTVVNEGLPYAGDGPRFATVSMRAPRATARFDFQLARRARISLSILETGQGVASEQPSTVAETSLREQDLVASAGYRTLRWTPPGLPAGADVHRPGLGARTGPPRPRRCTPSYACSASRRRSPRAARSPATPQTLVLRTDAKTLTVQMLRSGPETEPTYANNEIKGIPVGAPLEVDWRAHANAPAPISLEIGKDWPSGVYAAQLTADDGRVGFAPIVVRPPAPAARVAVAMPTSTWGAYNFYDANRDGWGDTWYARWDTMHADLTRPHAVRGVPYRYRSYDLAFQHWLAQTGKNVDVYADEDLELFTSPASLRAAYDLIVFPGHTEYVTKRLYDLIQVYRDLGGNLLFLSANNFFRKVDRRDHVLTLVDEWRDLGRPEAALLGNQYLASDRGQRRAPFTVVGADVAPWAFAGTGLGNGSTFGLYGIEIDARGPASPPQTQVLATIPDLFGPGRSAEMTYYEHASGARVFSAGALDFGGQALLWPQTTQILANVWQRLAT